MSSSSVTVTISFSPVALSRTNNKPYRKNPNPQINSKSKSKPKSKSLTSGDKLLSSSLAIEPTSYTRLPPRDDFFGSSLVDSYDEITLSESFVVQRIKEDSTKKSGKSGELGGLSVEDEMMGFNFDDYELPDEDEEEKGEEERDYDSGEEDSDYEDDIIGKFEEFEGEEVGFDEEEDEEEKEKGVPAVMRCFDRAKIYAKAGNGGNGVVAFRREKYVPFGGPSGGDGGRGGNVYVEVDGAMNSLLPFRNCCHFKAGRGSHGQGRKCNGAKGEDVVIKVAPGTVVREVKDDGSEGEVLLELLYPGQKALLLPGGRGGRGNAAFKSGMNKVPKIAENGEQGPEM